jgi:branched-chain amino acid transport system substrate-binding protein
VTYRTPDNQATLPVFVGKLAKKDGKGVMVDTTVFEGSKLLPPPAEAAKMRPSN